MDVFMGYTPAHTHPEKLIYIWDKQEGVPTPCKKINFYMG